MVPGGPRGISDTAVPQVSELPCDHTVVTEVTEVAEYEAVRLRTDHWITDSVVQYGWIWTGLGKDSIQ